MTLQHQKTASLTLLAIGAALVAMMVVVESEPGALPLALVLTGGAWYGRCLLVARRASRD